MAATTLGFIPLQLIPTNAIGQFGHFDKGFAANGTYVVVKTPTVAQQLQMKQLKEMQSGIKKEINNNENNKPVMLRCKRRVDFTGLGCKLVDANNPSVSRRNERERKRVKMVNMGFETLRQHVPVGQKNKKMSKVETLRSAVQYIKQLQDLLDQTDGGMADFSPSDVDMDALEEKVTEMIQKSNEDNNNNTNNNNSNCENDANAINSASDMNGQFSADVGNIADTPNSVYGNCEQAMSRLQPHVQQPMETSPQCSTGDPNSPDGHQQNYFTYPPCVPAYTSTYEQLTSATLTYSQASPAGSLHSPTSSVISDSSYDSVSQQEDEDILMFNWFN